MSIVNDPRGWFTGTPSGFQWLRVLNRVDPAYLSLTPIIFDIDTMSTLVKHSYTVTVSALTEVTLINETVPANKKHKYYSITVRCRRLGKVTVYADGVLIESGRTGPATPNVKIPLAPVETLLAGKKIEVKFKPSLNSPVATDIEAFARGIEQNE